MMRGQLSVGAPCHVIGQLPVVILQAAVKSVALHVRLIHHVEPVLTAELIPVPVATAQSCTGKTSIETLKGA